MVRLAEFFVSHGFDPRVDNGRNGAQALAYACYLNALNDGLINGLKYLLKVGADPSCPFGVIDSEGADSLQIRIATASVMAIRRPH